MKVFLATGFLLTSISVAHGKEAPLSVTCSKTGSMHCNPDGVCIPNKLRTTTKVTFDFVTSKFSSKFGSGKIVVNQAMEDGRHYLVLLAPPLGPREIIFSADYKIAEISQTEGAMEQYSCF